MAWKSGQRSMLLSNRKLPALQERILVGKSYLNPVPQTISSFQDFRLQFCMHSTTHFLRLILLDMHTFHSSKSANYESPRYARFYSLSLLPVSY
jgi:hypothetical protein